MTPRRGLRTLFKDAAVYGVTGAIGPSIQILLVPFYSRVFEPEQYGAVEIVIATIAALSLLLGLQMDSGLARHFHGTRTGEERSRLVSTGLWTVLAASGAGASLLALLAPGVSRALTGTADFAPAVALAGASVPLSLALTYMMLVFRLERRVVTYAAIGSAWAVATLGLSLLIVVVLDGGVTGVFLAKVLADGGAAAAALALGARHLRRRLSRPALASIAAYGLPLVPAVLGNWGLRYVDRFLVTSILSLSSLGVYVIAVHVSSVLLFVNRAFSLSWVPFSMAAIGEPGSERLYARALDAYLAIALGIAAPIMLFSGTIVDLVAPPRYAGAATFVGPLLVAWIARGVGSIVSIGTSIARRTTLISLATLVGILVNVGLQAFLLPRIGTMGAALGTASGAAMTAFLLFRYSQRSHRVPYGMGRALGAMLLVLAAVAGTIALSDRLPGSEWGWRAAGTSLIWVGLLGYGLAGRATRLRRS